MVECRDEAGDAFDDLPFDDLEKFGAITGLKELSWIGFGEMTEI